jgi:hypothetical protein
MKDVTMKRNLIISLLAMAALLCAAAPALAVSPYINYQGILHDDTGNPLNGAFVLTFRLYTSPTSGTAIWAEPHTTYVTNGLFNVVLGSVTPMTLELWDADERWLGIQIGSEPEMYPLLQMTSVSWAFRAAVADSLAGGGGMGDGHSLDADDGSPLDVVYVNYAGNVGIGTEAPSEKLQVVGTTQTDGFKMPTGATPGWVLTSDGAGVGTWQPAGGVTGDGDWTISGADMYAAPTGNVGLGTTSPLAKLDILDGRPLRSQSNGSRPAMEAKHINSGNLAYIASLNAALHGISENQVGVHGESDSLAVLGENTSDTQSMGYLAGDYGAYGESRSGNYGYLGGASFAIYGAETMNDNYGGIGYWNYGVLGHSDSQTGVFGRAVGGTGVGGMTNTGWAVYGTHTASGNYGYIGGSSYGLFAESEAGTAVFGLSISGYAGKFQGDVQVQGDFTVVGGEIYTPVLEITGGSDLSEGFDIAGGSTGLDPEPGMLVCVDPSRPGQLMVSHDTYDTRVAGVISGAGGVKPGLLMGQQGSAASGRTPVALTGRVYCMADASQGSIAPGDLLTTSGTPGHAMKATDGDRSHGAIIGKAMTDLESGQGLVLVLVSLQ